MPNYDYKCTGCDSQYILYAKIDERNDQKCPKCDTILTIAVPKKLSFILKGDGFASHELALDKHHNLIREVEAEGGYATKTEREVGIAAGIDRAIKKGMDPRIIVGKETYESGCIEDTSELADVFS